MKLNELQPKEGSTKNRIRVGRGIGSGKGKTGGRGVKGQKSRSGVAIKGFEGGQMPLYMRLPKRGFRNIFGTEFATINLSQLQAAVDAKRIDAKKPVSYESLQEAGLVSKAKDGLKILGNGQISAKLEIVAQAATQAAQDTLGKAGAKLTLQPLAKREALPASESRKAVRGVTKAAAKKAK